MSDEKRTVAPRTAKKRSQQRRLTFEPLMRAKHYPVPTNVMHDDRLTRLDYLVAGLIIWSIKCGEHRHTAIPISYTQIARGVKATRANAIASVSRLLTFEHFIATPTKDGHTFRVGTAMIPTAGIATTPTTSAADPPGGDCSDTRPDPVVGTVTIPPVGIATIPAEPKVGIATIPTIPPQTLSPKAATRSKTSEETVDTSDRSLRDVDHGNPPAVGPIISTATQSHDREVASTNEHERIIRNTKRVIRNAKSGRPPNPRAQSWIQRAVQEWARFGVIGHSQAGGLWKPVYDEMLREADSDQDKAANRFIRALGAYLDDRKREGWAMTGPAGFARAWRKFDGRAEVVDLPGIMELFQQLGERENG